MRSERAHRINETISQAARALVATLSTSYGPKGLDKMLVRDGKSIVTNDGATILGYYKTHPVHKILSSVSAAQDTNCGDGTTSVVLLACCLIDCLGRLRERGIHASRIVDALEIAKRMALRYIDDVRIGIGEGEFISVALTSLSSKIASRSQKLAQAAVDALSCAPRSSIRVVKRVGGNIDDIEMHRSIVLERGEEIPHGRYKVLLLQFCLSAPKTNMDSKVLINDYSLMERFVREEREYVVGLVRAIRRSGADLLFIQKSLLRDSCSDLAKHFLGKLGIRHVDGVDRAEMEFLGRVLGVKPASDVDLLQEPLDVEVRSTRGMVEIMGHGCSVVVSGCDQMVVDEAARSLNDVFGVVQSLMAEPSIVPGGGSIETGISVLLEGYTGAHSLIVNEIGRGFIAMPHFLAQNSGIYSVDAISQLRKNIPVNHNLGISLRSGLVADMVNDEKIIQPAAVSRSMVTLAIEAVQMLLRIDDILPTVQ